MGSFPETLIDPIPACEAHAQRHSCSALPIFFFRSRWCIVGLCVRSSERAPRTSISSLFYHQPCYYCHRKPPTPHPLPSTYYKGINRLLILPGSFGVGVTSSPLYTLNSFTAGSLFLPATLDTKTRNSYLEPLSRPVTLYS